VGSLYIDGRLNKRTKRIGHFQMNAISFMIDSEAYGVKGISTEFIQPIASPARSNIMDLLERAHEMIDDMDEEDLE
jgi:hypothetical protein